MKLPQTYHEVAAADPVEWVLLGLAVVLVVLGAILGDWANAALAVAFGISRLQIVRVEHGGGWR